MTSEPFHGLASLLTRRLRSPRQIIRVCHNPGGSPIGVHVPLPVSLSAYDFFPGPNFLDHSPRNLVTHP